jgi:RNA polymerase sigma factor (sigma-70 family)
MAQEPDFAALVEGLRQGDPDAARLIFQRFTCQLIALARRHLSDRVRRKVDPEDIVQSAFKSFFTRQVDGQYVLTGWDSLWGLLTVITLRKCGYRLRHYQAARRDLRREVSPVADPEDAVTVWQPVAREPTPAEAAVLAEAVEQLFRDLQEPQRPIVELALQGYTAAEISAETGSAERTVYRILERLKRKLQHLSDDDEA